MIISAGAGTLQGGHVRLSAGAPSGNVYLEAASGGAVQARASSLQLRPTAGQTQSELRLGIRDDFSQYYTLKADDAKFSVLGPQGQELLAFPLNGQLGFGRSSTFANNVAAMSGAGDASLSASTASTS